MMPHHVQSKLYWAINKSRMFVSLNNADGSITHNYEISLLKTNSAVDRKLVWMDYNKAFGDAVLRAGRCVNNIAGFK